MSIEVRCIMGSQKKSIGIIIFLLKLFGINRERRRGLMYICVQCCDIMYQLFGDCLGLFM